MPWIDKKKCIGCGACLNICPPGAISFRDGKAEIDMSKCIRCGKCHDICPHDAVRHDSERIPFEVRENIKETMELMKNFKGKEKKAFLERMVKHFNKERAVAENTLKEIKKLMVDG
jgi:ferredoxin